MKNIDKPFINLCHKNLKRCTDESPFRSHCPFCEKGVLLVARDQGTLKLLPDDVCLSCGQRVHYIDAIEERNANND